MNYANHYERLISRARNRNLECYTERHHIVPSCMGGGNDSDNLVRLTPEEHYTAHLLLVKMYPHVSGLAYAASRQARSLVALTGRANKLYGWLRRKHAEANRNRTISPETRKKMSESQKKRKWKPLSSEWKAKIAAANKGKPKSQSHREALSQAKTGKNLGPQTPEHLAKRIDAMKKIVIDKSFTKTEEYRRKQSEIAKRSWAARKAKAQQIQNS